VWLKVRVLPLEPSHFSWRNESSSVGKVFRAVIGSTVPASPLTLRV
jgi:hypothetical protein